MTIKTLLGHKWIFTHCPSAQFYVKADDDVFVNMQRLVQQISWLQQTNIKRAIMGPLCRHSPVERGKGKWGISENDFPFTYYPFYAAGALYIMTSDIVEELFSMSEYVRPIHIDDVYITGILGVMVNVCHVGQISMSYYRVPHVCAIISTLTTAHNMTPQKMKEIWKLAKQVNGNFKNCWKIVPKSKI